MPANHLAVTAHDDGRRYTADGLEGRNPLALKAEGTACGMAIRDRGQA